MTHEALLQHDGVLYASEDEFLAVVIPFVRAAVARGDLTVCVTSRNDLVREALGYDARHVDFMSADEWFARPATTFGAYQQFVEERLGTPGACATVLAEAVWAMRGPAEVSEWQRLEAVVNRAFAAAPMRVMCCYDARRAPEDLQDTVGRTHSALCAIGGRNHSHHYEDPERFIDQLERSLRLPPPPSASLHRAPVHARLAELRAFVQHAATAAGLPPSRIDEVVLAVNELLTNHLKYSGGDGELLAWTERDEVVFELRDRSGRRPPPLGGYVRDEREQTRGWGLALVRRIADLVHVSGGEGYSAIRARFGAGSPYEAGDGTLAGYR